MQRLAAALDNFAPEGRVLELACGTGLFTRHLIRHASSVTALDASAEMLAINRDRCGAGRVRYLQADVFNWRPDTTYDVVFFSFWLSHVPPDLFDSFWQLVADSLEPTGRVFFMDSLRTASSTAIDHCLPPAESATVRRRLDDGREFDVVKVFHDPAVLRQRLQQSGWKASISATPEFFLFGSAERDRHEALSGAGAPSSAKC